MELAVDGRDQGVTSRGIGLNGGNNEAYVVTVVSPVAAKGGKGVRDNRVVTRLVVGGRDPPNRELVSLHMCLTQFYRTFKEGLQVRWV